ncbi:hypothetical protein GQ43DRAFT_397943 [Delitschia confertaspora ATCC 74209]|uniref:Uncharacterized protein n=1 Tax=Delitschia confertaspora ATCC 74209 TaxID=1513339 RepID=A0A9P4JIK6_9PLEO|nr:hypothetical protein GQ43DRAFT_397943 [Delitschia confertaspora ATCC 74209]
MPEEATKATFLATTRDTLITFFALYFTTLFSLDTWAAARNSPYREASSTYYRPADTRATRGPSRDSRYYAPSVRPGGSGGEGRIGSGDSREPLKFGGAASCGACMI